MDETNGMGGVDAEQVVRLDGGQILKSDSALVHAALELLATHVADTEGESTTLCAHCGLFYPCPTVQHARQVVNAGGLAESLAESLARSLAKSTDSASAVTPASARAEAESVEAVESVEEAMEAVESVELGELEEAEPADDRFEARDPVGAV